MVGRPVPDAGPKSSGQLPTRRTVPEPPDRGPRPQPSTSGQFRLKALDSRLTPQDSRLTPQDSRLTVSEPATPLPLKVQPISLSGLAVLCGFARNSSTHDSRPALILSAGRHMGEVTVLEPIFQGDVIDRVVL